MEEFHATANKMLLKSRKQVNFSPIEDKNKKTSKRGTEDKSTEKAEDSRKTPRLRQVNLTSRL